MFLLIPSAVLILYACISGVLPLKMPIVWKIVLCLLIVAVGLKYQIYTLGSGTLFAPAVSRTTMLCMEAAYGALVVFVCLLVLKDFANLGIWLLKKFGVPLGLTFNTAGFISVLVVIAILSGIYGCYQAIRVPDVRSVTINIKNLPEAWKGLKVVQLSDLHIGAVQGKGWLEAVVRKTNAVKPDLIVITGDFVDGSVAELAKEMQPLTELKAPYGVLAIPGNHEYYSGYYAWMKELSSLGVTMLQNQSKVLEKDGSTLVIGGTTDYGASRFAMPSPNLEQTFKNTPEGATRILLTHQPKTTHQSKERFDLQLSGHTHGGHLIFLYPLIGAFNDGLVLGLYSREDRLIYVNRGTGLWNGFSMRLGVPSEITEITLE